MLDKMKGWAAPLLALTLLSASALQANGQAPTPEQIQETAAAAAPAPQLTSDDLNAWLDGFMPYTLANADIVGAVVTVVRDGQIVANRGYGYSNLEERTPVDPNATLFRPGSISKLFTWTAVMQQVEQGNIDLDADINTYLDFEIRPYQGQPLTMRQIMTHTSGFEEVIRDLIMSDEVENLPTLEGYLRDNQPERIYPPGTMPAYSNYATALAGYVVQRVSGKPFETYLQDNIFTPLGMRNSTFVQPLPEEMRTAMSGGYRNVKDGEAQYFEVIPASPAGALSTTGADMALFMAAHLNGGAGLLQPETARLMHETISEQFPGVNNMALGFYQEHYGGQRILAHGGDTQFFHSNLSLLMDQNVGVYISVNSGGGPTMGARLLRWEFMDAFVNRYFPVEETTTPEPLATAREHGAAMVGAYDDSRRSQTSPLLAIYSIGQTSIAMLPNGDLVGPGLPGLNGEPTNWREVEPWIWQAVGGHERLAARRDDNGRVVAFAVEPLSFAIVSMRAPWYRDKTWIVPALCFALGVLALTLLSWPVRAVVRRVYRTPFPYEGARAQVHRIGAGASLLLVGYVVAWMGFIVFLMESLNVSTGDAMKPFFMTLYILGVMPIVAIAGLAFANFRLWTAPSSWFAKIWGALLLISGFVLLWFAAVMNFFSFDFRY